MNAGPSPARWAEFTLAQQVLMIANDLHRASKWTGVRDTALRRGAYARALALTDLAAAGSGHRLAFRREILRWRELLAALYLEEARPVRNAELLRTLLRFTFETLRQIPHVPGL